MNNLKLINGSKKEKNDYTLNFMNMFIISMSFRMMKQEEL